MGYGQSQFPTQVDDFIQHLEITASEVEDVQRYQELKLKENRTAAEDTELSNLTNQLRDKLLTAQDFNKLQDAIKATQIHYRDEVDGYVTQKQNEMQAEIDKFDDKGDYNSTTTYNQNNFVRYNYETYICLQDGVVGVTPSDDGTNWRLMAQRGGQGERGLAGANLVFRGTYDPSITYNVDDAVEYNGSVYYCTATVVGETPQDDGTSWDLFLARGSILVSDSSPTSPTDKQVWIDSTTDMMNWYDSSSSSWIPLNAEDSNKLGGQLPSHYATSQNLSAANDKITTLQSEVDDLEQENTKQEKHIANIVAKQSAQDRLSSSANDYIYELINGSGDTGAITVDNTRTTSTQSLASGTTVLAGVTNGEQTSVIEDYTISNKLLVGQKLTVLDDTVSEETEVTRAESQSNTTTNTVTDKTVVSSAYTTSKNARPQVLDNGWLVTCNDSNGFLYVSKNNGDTWSILCELNYNIDYKKSMVSSGNYIYLILETGNSIMHYEIDATSVSSDDMVQSITLDSNPDETDSVSLAISPDKTTLLASWASKNSAVPYSFNPRYVLGTINNDNTVTWESVKQLTSWNNSNDEGYTNVVSQFDNSVPIITSRRLTGGVNKIVIFRNDTSLSLATDLSDWTYGNIYDGGSYTQSSPDLVTDTNGDLLCAWHGTDSGDSNNAIRFSKSSDGGSTWSAMEKLTSTNSSNVSITVDLSNNVYLLFESWDGSNTSIHKLVYDGTSWGSKVKVTDNTTAYTLLPSTLYDNTFTLDFSEPLFIYKDEENSKVGFYGTWQAIKEQFYLECTALANSYKKDALIARTTADYDTTNERLKFGGWSTEDTTTVTDAEVTPNAYDTSGNGGRKLIQLDNGTLVSASLTSSSSGDIKLHKSLDNGVSWSEFKNLGTFPTLTDVSIVGVGNEIKLMFGRSSIVGFYTVHLDGSVEDYSSVDSSQDSIGNVTLTTNAEKTKLYGAASTKNSTYPNSFNIRYYETDILSDGSVGSWSTTQVTGLDSTSADLIDPSITVKNGYPHILTLYEATNDWYNVIDLTNEFSTRYYSGTYWDSSSWGNSKVYRVNAYAQSSPSAIFVPSTYSQSGSDEIHVSWHGYDSTDTSAYNVRYAISTDGGANWTVSKLTSGNTDSKAFPSITADLNKNIYIVYEAGGSDLRRLINNGSWSAENTIKTGLSSPIRPSALFDNTFSLDFSEPLFIYQDNEAIKVGFYGTWTVGTSVPLLNNVVRYTTNSQVKEIVSWIYKDANLTTDVYYNSSLATKTLNSDSTEVETQFSSDTLQNVDMKIEMSRPDTTTDVGINKILGGVE